MGTHQHIHEQFAKRAANVLSLYHTNKGKTKLGEIRWENTEISSTWRPISFLSRGWRWGNFPTKMIYKNGRQHMQTWRQKKKFFLMKWGALSTVWARKYATFKIPTINFKSLLNALREMKGLPTMENIFLRLKTNSAHWRLSWLELKQLCGFHKHLASMFNRLPLKRQTTYEINVETKAQKSGECSTPATNTNNYNMEKVEQILYLLDKFCVSDEFYHEFSMIENGLPRSYLIKQCRSDQTNSVMWHLLLEHVRVHKYHLNHFSRNKFQHLKRKIQSLIMAMKHSI